MKIKIIHNRKLKILNLIRINKIIINIIIINDFLSITKLVKKIKGNKLQKVKKLIIQVNKKLKTYLAIINNVIIIY